MNLKFSVRLKSLVCVLMGLAICVAASAQQKVSGKVVDSDGEPIPGAAVMVKGTQNGTVTDFDGNWTLNVKNGDVLLFTSIGLSDTEVAFNGPGSVAKVTLAESAEFLENAVVIGYGTMDKKMVTSAIASIGGEALMPGAGDASVAQALRGKIANLVVSGSDSPNASSTFQLRGMASINAGKGPLIVIDGMPGGDIASILPEDIQSIDVLKDAAAGAIYGSRAAGGVILITTKDASRMSDGTVSVSYTGEVSHKTAVTRPDVLTADEFRKLRTPRDMDYGDSFDWFDGMLNKDNFSQKHTVNVKSNSKVASVYATMQYNKNEGLALFDSRDDYAGRMNATFHLFKGWLDLSTRMDYRRANKDSHYPSFAAGFINNPTRSAYDPTSDTGYNIWLYDELDMNEIGNSALKSSVDYVTYFLPEVNAKLNVLAIPGLSYTQTASFQRVSHEVHKWEPQDTQKMMESGIRGSSYNRFNKSENYNVEGFFNYDKSWGNHNLDATAGYSYYEKNSESFYHQVFDFAVQGFKYWNDSASEEDWLTKAEFDSDKDITEKLLSYFGRVNYDYAQKYIVSASLRREASSKFPAKNRWGTFYSISAGWRITGEDFMQGTKNWLDDLKVRAAYGVTGNSGFSADYVERMYSDDAPIAMPGDNSKWIMTYGLEPDTREVNPDLRWEEQHGINIGLDYSLFNRRIYGKFDWYTRNVVDMLYEVDVPTPPYVEGKMMKNVGNLRNRGWEFEIGSDIVRGKNFTWNTELLLSHEHTVLETLDGNGTIYYDGSLPKLGDQKSPGKVIRLSEGSTIGQFYTYKCAGINPATGGFNIYTGEGDKIIDASVDSRTESYMQFVGNYVPKIMGSWNNRFSYKNWDLAVNLRSWIDFDVYNTYDMYFGLPSATATNVMHSAYGKNKDIKQTMIPCSYFIQDGTFLKIDDINLAYTFPLKKLTNGYVHSVRAYVNIHNAATFTNYEGVDPEVNITGYAGGIDSWSSYYPRTRTYVFGLKLNF